MIDWNVKLYKAARCGNIPAMEHALKNGANINTVVAIYPGKVTALSESIKNIQLESVKWLLEHDVEIYKDIVYELLFLNPTTRNKKIIELIYCNAKTLEIKSKIISRIKTLGMLEMAESLINKERILKLKQFDD
jgi:ankyrin repeat protein